MALVHSFETSGSFLFKYRGQLPIVLFILAIPILFFTNHETIPRNVIIGLRVIAVVCSLLGLVIRAITIGTTPKGTSGRNRDEQVAEQLNHTGIYSTLRHPLYLGNYLMWVGIVIYTFNIYFFLLFSLAFWLYYERIMFVEERFLERKFGKSYLDWSLEIPAFIPSFKCFVKSTTPFSIKSVLRREYSGFFATIISFIFVDILRDFFSMEEFELNSSYIYIIFIGGLITLILRSLKHYTKVLDEKDRS